MAINIASSFNSSSTTSLAFLLLMVSINLKRLTISLIPLLFLASCRIPTLPAPSISFTLLLISQSCFLTLLLHSLNSCQIVSMPNTFSLSCSTIQYSLHISLLLHVYLSSSCISPLPFLVPFLARSFFYYACSLHILNTRLKYLFPVQMYHTFEVSYCAVMTDDVYLSSYWLALAAGAVG